MSSRRNFIKNIALTAGATSLVSMNSFASSGQEELIYVSGGDNTFKPIKVEGRVISKGKGIARVSVSDGQQVVLTDANGYFSIVSHNQRDFVFLSIPSGYEIKQLSNGSADFFYRIDKNKATNKVEFVLKPLQESDHTHHFLVLADPQIQKIEEAEQLLSESVPDMLGTIKSLGSTNVFGIGCGDLIWDKHELFEKYNQAVKNLSIPFFQVFGNHDADLGQRSDEKTHFTFNSMYGPQYYSFNRGEIHYVVLDDVFFIGKGKEYIGYLTEEQLAWLEKDLANVPKGSTVVVSQHIPSYTGYFERNPKSSSLGAMVSNREYLYRILEGYNAHLMSGHTHFNETIVLNDSLIEHCHGTVCGAWWSGPICFDGTPGGYGVYTAKGSQLEWYYKGTGLSKDVQFRTYRVGEHFDFKDNWSVNIWNWDTQWQAYWYEDGVRKGELVRVTAKDPLSIKLHEGPKLPEKRKWVEPELTDHMFLFKPSKTVKSITVEVIDRFGRVYSELYSL